MSTHDHIANRSETQPQPKRPSNRAGRNRPSTPSGAQTLRVLETLGIIIRWNVLFRCYEIRLPDAGGWLPASQDWKRDDVHAKVRWSVNQHPEFRHHAADLAYGNALELVHRTSESAGYSPLDDLTPLPRGHAVTPPHALVAHITALQKVEGACPPPEQPLLVLPESTPLMPAAWADLERFAFDVRSTRGVTKRELESLYRCSNAPDRRPVVLVGPLKPALVKSGLVRVEEGFDPEWAFQEADWYLTFAPRFRVEPSTAPVGPRAVQLDYVPELAEIIVRDIVREWEPSRDGYQLAELVAGTESNVDMTAEQAEAWLAKGNGMRVGQYIAAGLRENGYTAKKRTGRRVRYWNREADWNPTVQPTPEAANQAA